MRFAYHVKVSSLAIVVVLGTLVGCASYHWPFPTQRSQVDDRWGDAFESNVAKMTANPDAGRVGEPIALDPETGELVWHRYRESQKAKPSESELGSLIRIDTAR